MIHLLLLGELAERVVADGVVALGHAQGAAALAGDAGEALAPGEVVDGHLVEADILPAKLLLPLQDGRGCGAGGGRQRGAVRSKKTPWRSREDLPPHWKRTFLQAPEPLGSQEQVELVLVALSWLWVMAASARAALDAT